MKKYFVLILTIIILSIFCRFHYTSVKCKNLDYAIEKYTTTGILNNDKLYSLDKYIILFSDDQVAVVQITGLSNDAPNKVTKYNLLLEKNKRGIWKSKKYYNHT